MSVKKRFGVLAAVVGLVLSLTAVAWGNAGLVKPTSFQSNGDLISGWYWLRATSHTATWTFDSTALQGAKSGSVHLNLSALVTNGVNGGSGYSTAVKATVDNGVKTRTSVISLNNPFRPRDPGNSGGIGYQAYGSTGLSSSTWKGATKITVTLTFPSIRRGYHVAVNQDALVIGYSAR